MVTFKMPLTPALRRKSLVSLPGADIMFGIYLLSLAVLLRFLAIELTHSKLKVQFIVDHSLEHTEGKLGSKP